METKRRTKKGISIRKWVSLNASKTAGFTYLELILTVTLTFLLIPVLFTLLFLFNSPTKQLVAQQTQQMQADLFTSQVSQELRKAVTFTAVKNECQWTNSEGQTVRYLRKGDRLVRQVYVPAKGWKGYLVMIQPVDKVQIDCGSGHFQLQIWLNNKPISVYYRQKGGFE